MKYEELGSNIGSKTSGSDGREIRGFIDDVFDYVAIAFQVPPQLLKGNVADTEKAFNNFLTFCINPLAELLTDEINRKLYGKDKFLERTYVKLDTTRIKAVDIKDVASALDILTRIGAYSVDDSLRVLGMEPLDTSWSKVRWMTKNYQRIEELAGGGG
jgi:Phage portal protein.